MGRISNTAKSHFITHHGTISENSIVFKKSKDSASKTDHVFKASSVHNLSRMTPRSHREKFNAAFKKISDPNLNLLMSSMKLSENNPQAELAKLEVPQLDDAAIDKILSAIYSTSEIFENSPLGTLLIEGIILTEEHRTLVEKVIESLQKCELKLQVTLITLLLKQRCLNSNQLLSVLTQMELLENSIEKDPDRIRDSIIYEIFCQSEKNHEIIDRTLKKIHTFSATIQQGILENYILQFEADPPHVRELIKLASSLKTYLGHLLPDIIKKSNVQTLLNLSHFLPELSPSIKFSLLIALIKKCDGQPNELLHALKMAQLYLKEPEQKTLAIMALVYWKGNSEILQCASNLLQIDDSSFLDFQWIGFSYLFTLFPQLDVKGQATLFQTFCESCKDPLSLNSRIQLIDQFSSLIDRALLTQQVHHLKETLIADFNSQLILTQLQKRLKLVPYT